MKTRHLFSSKIIIVWDWVNLVEIRVSTARQEPIELEMGQKETPVGTYAGHTLTRRRR